MNTVVKLIKKLLWALLVLFLLCFIIDPFLPPHRASDRALEASCQNNLKLMSIAIDHYMAEHNEALPESLQALVDCKYLEKDIIKCPLANIQGGMYFYSCKDKRIESDYNYTRNINNKQKILCWDKAGNHSHKTIPDSINVLFNDGWVRGFPAADLKKQIQDCLESFENDSGIGYIYFRWHDLRRSSMPECLIYSDPPDNELPVKLPDIADSSWLIKIKPKALKKIGDILQEKLPKNDLAKVDSNNKYLAIIFYRGGGMGVGSMNYRRLNETILDKQLQQDILKEIPANKQSILEQVFKKIQSGK